MSFGNTKLCADRWNDHADAQIGDAIDCKRCRDRAIYSDQLSATITLRGIELNGRRMHPSKPTRLTGVRRGGK